jgi:hypothetical protein
MMPNSFAISSQPSYLEATLSGLTCFLKLHEYLLAVFLDIPRGFFQPLPEC